jgi:hypothetical protein
VTRNAAIAAAAALLVVVALGSPIPFLSRERLAATFADDAFYYFQIARHVASGHGVTFDGIHTTNGFHPLWLAALVPVFALVDGDVAPLRVVALIETLLVALAAVLVFRAQRDRIGHGPAFVAAVALVALPGARGILRSGMETSLLVVLIVLIWTHWLDAPRPSLRLGTLCGLAALSRFEAFLLVPVLVVADLRRGAMTPRSFFALTLPPITMLGAYLAWSRLTFGTALPVSALVKHHWSREASTPWAPFVVALGVLVVAAAWRWLPRGVRSGGAAVVVVASGLIALADAIAVRDLELWYEGPLLLSLALIVGALFVPAPRLSRIAVAAVVVAALARGPLLMWTLREPDRAYAYHRIHAADWARATIPASEAIGSWNAGMFAYFSHRSVVNLDGLVNDLGYYRSVVEGGDLEGYLDREAIHWLADHVCGPARCLPALTGPVAERLALAEVFRSAHAGDDCPGFGVWRTTSAPARGGGADDRAEATVVGEIAGDGAAGRRGIARGQPGTRRHEALPK